MASVILRTVGTAIGNTLLPGIGGAFFGVIGAAAGGFADNLAGLSGHVTGPRLDNLNVQDSRYGAGIPIVYGNARIAGNVIWSTDLMQTTHTNNVSGGKGGGLGGSVTSTTYTYSVHCAVGISLGPIGDIATIWADSNIIYQNGIWTAGVVDGAVIYRGSSTQTSDAFMESILGSGNVPAYRGLAYIVFDNLQLSGFGNRLPNLTFEITPSQTTRNPQLLGSVDAGISQITPATANGGIRPITLSRSGSNVLSVLVGGYILSGTNCHFDVAAYDVTDITPVETARSGSVSFTVNNLNDVAWAIAPDQRFVAMYVLDASPVTHNFVIYDTATGQFGNIYTTTGIGISQALKQIAWIDAQHFVIEDVVGTTRGVHVFARAGMTIVDLGFYAVWGAGSSTSRRPIYGAQYTSYAGGLLNYMSDNGGGGSYFTTLYARPLVWRNNNLVVGTAYTVASGLTPGINSGAHVNLVQTGNNEWTLCFATVNDFHLISFEPSASAATVTRPWQNFTPAAGTGTAQVPVIFGNRLIIVQTSPSDNFYHLSEVTLNSGSFTLAIDGLGVANATGLAAYFSAVPLDGVRLLLTGIGGFGFDIFQLCIIQRCITGDSLGAIIADILSRAGYANSDYDVSALAGTSVNGFVLPEPMTARAAIEPLQVYAPFDLVESGNQLKAVPRHGTIDVAIPASEWRTANDKKAPPPALQITRAQELDLPKEVDLDYIDPARNYEVNSQRARRGASRAQSVQKINLPIVCSSSIAKQTAEARLYALWAERELVRLSLSRRWLALDPGDIIDLGNGSHLRAANINQAGSLMEIDGFYVDNATYGSAATADANHFIDGVSATFADSTLYLMDLPLLQSADDQPGLYAAATGLAGWKGAALWRAADAVNYNNIATLSHMATAGIAISVLSDGSGFYMDGINSVSVQLINGALSSCTSADLLNGANAAALGNEIIQFQTATLTGPGLYVLSNLLRGRRGTESAATTHAIGENFVLLTSGTVDFVPALLSDRNAAYEFRALSNGQTLNDAQDTVFTYGLATLRPFSPVNVTGARAGGTGSDLTINWVRRARLNAEWVDYVDVPLDEPTEFYDVDIMNGGSVTRTFASLTAPTVTYTAAQQSADWGGGIPASFTVNIYQISSRYGRGQAATAIL